MTTIPSELTTAPEWAQDVFLNLPPLASYDDIAHHARMNRGSIANFHSEGKGPKGSLLMGRKRVFPRLDVVRWLLDFAESTEKKAV